MFKKENQIWLYLIGIIIMFGILIASTTNILMPAFSGGSQIDIIGNSFTSAPELTINPNLDYYLHVDTNQGRITIDLFEKSAPKNVNNIIHLADKGYYTNTKFHRLISDFLLQGGDRNTLNNNHDDDGLGRPGYLIDDEINWDSLSLSSERRTILTELGYKNTTDLTTPRFQKYYMGMANGVPNTNGSQFFILINNESDDRVRQLDGMYTPVGKVIEGYDVLEKINSISVDNPDSQSPRPTQDIIIEGTEVFTK